MSFFRYFLASSIGTVLVLSAVMTPAARAEMSSSSSESSSTEQPALDDASSAGGAVGGIYRAIASPANSVDADSVEDEAAQDVAQADDALPDLEPQDTDSLEPRPEELDDLIEPSPDRPEALDAAPVLEEEEEEEAADPAMGDRPSLLPSSADTVDVPEYLNPSPNRLFYPTVSDEVEIVETTPISLEQAIELARRNSTTLQDAFLNLEVSEAALRQAQAANLPTLDAQGSLVRQDVSDQAPPPLIGEEPSSVTTTLGAALVLNYDIFTSGQRSALIRAAEYRVRLQELQVEVISEQLKLDVTNAYYDLQESDEQVRIDQSALERAEQSLRDAEALERAGVGTRFSVLTAQVEVANARQALFRSLSNQQITRREITRLLNLAQVVNVSAADAVEPVADWPLSLEDTITLSYQNRAELEQQLIQRDISDRLRRAELAALGPQVSAFARYDFQDLLDENNSSSDREVYQVGLQVNMRLFDGGAARAAARQEERNMELAENSFTDTRNQIRFQVEQAYYNLLANRESIETATLAVTTAEEALRLARLRFQAGIETQTDVLLAQTDLTQAEVNLLRAILDYNRAVAALRRSVSNFPDNDLSDRP